MRKIIFDIGNVLFHVNFDKFNERLESLNIHFQNTSKLKTFVNDIQAHQDLGIIDMSQALRHHLGVDDKFIPILLEEWNNCLKPNEKMMQLIEKYRSGVFEIGYHPEPVQLAVASNMGTDHFAYLSNTYHIIFERNKGFSNIDAFISSQIGARKPSKLFFQSIMMDYPQYKGALFVDDRPENLKAASMYFDTYLFDLEKATQENNIDKHIEQILQCSKFY